MAASAAAEQNRGTADLVAEMELAIEKNNYEKVAELLAQIRHRRPCESGAVPGEKNQRVYHCRRKKRETRDCLFAVQ
jgi:hypothetical protein